MSDRRIRQQFGKAVREFALIEDGDAILIGLSGGKDSLLLTELLARQSKIFKPRFTVEAAHVRMENVEYESDLSALRQFCDVLGVRLHILTTAIPQPTADHPAPQPCFRCSWQRRKMLFGLAQELHCNKIALGHHMDDIIHTALLNLFHEGRFGTMPVRLKLGKMPLTIIRPLCMMSEADIQAYAEERNYPRQRKRCPYEQESQREEMKQLFQHIEKQNPEVRHSIWHALTRDGKLVEP